MEPDYCTMMIALTALPSGLILLGALGIAGRVHATTLAGVSDQEIMLTIVTVGTSETVGEDAAFEIAAKHPLDMGSL
jgi:hypothetical protein